MKLRNYILFTLSLLLFTACQKETEVIKEIINEVYPGYESHYYYSYIKENAINYKSIPDKKESDFIPGAVYVTDKFVYVANTAEKQYSVELFDAKTLKHVRSLKSWTYKNVTETFLGKTEDIIAANGRLYVANISSRIDVFDQNTLEFITCIGTGSWGGGSNQLVHSHALAIRNGLIIVRDKEKIQVYQDEQVTPENYKKVNWYARSKTGLGYNTNFNTHSMTMGPDSLIYLTDYARFEIQTLSSDSVQQGQNRTLIDPTRTVHLPARPLGIAFSPDSLLYLSLADGRLVQYDLEQNKAVAQLKAISGYVFAQPDKIFFKDNILWVTDKKNKQLIKVRREKNEIKEYE